MKIVLQCNLISSENGANGMEEKGVKTCIARGIMVNIILLTNVNELIEYGYVSACVYLRVWMYISSIELNTKFPVDFKLSVFYNFRCYLCLPLFWFA